MRWPSTSPATPLGGIWQRFVHSPSSLGPQSAVATLFVYFNWLLGDWKRLNEEDGKETFENWEKVSATEYAGIGFTLQKGDTISKEHIQLLKVNQNWDLVVSLGSGSEPVTFKGFTHAETEFSCENIANDFPNIIKYWKHTFIR